MKIISILGARPQFIKAAAISRAIRIFNDEDRGIKIQDLIVHTGQHYDANMSEVFFEEMDIPRPWANLQVSGLNHGTMTGRMMERLEPILEDHKPDWVLVYGDTNSTLAGALVASKLHFRIAHVESGLRSYNLAMPEEVNRILTDRISSLLFCPTQQSVNNLLKEGYPFPVLGKRQQKVSLVGDVMLDAVLYYKEKARNSVELSRWNLQEKSYALATIHRAENTDNLPRLESIATALRKISLDMDVILPLHPRTYKKLRDSNKLDVFDGIRIVDPLSYFEIQRVQMSASLILTDSGGVQKEAYFHEVPCITLREETEWVETVEAGWNVTVGADTDLILKEYASYKMFNRPIVPLYGTGNSASAIIEGLINF